MTTMEVAADPDVFSDADRERLEQLEHAITSGLAVFIEVGRALSEIHERRLYKIEYRSFEAYLAERWNLSQSRGRKLVYGARVADVLEAAGEHPSGSDNALQQFSMILHRDGPEAVVQAFREVAPDGKLPSGPETRAKLASAGFADRPERDVTDQMQTWIRQLEKAVVAFKPHPKLLPPLAGYVLRLRSTADKLDALVSPVVPLVPAGEPCLSHGSRRGADGICTDCLRPDLHRPR